MRADIFIEAWGRLAPREQAVLSTMAEDGCENEEIAEALGIAVSTVETHRARGLSKIATYGRLDGLTLRRFTSLWWKHVRGK